MKIKRLIHVALAVIACATTSRAMEEIIELPPFVTEADSIPDFFDGLYDNWYEPVIDANLFGDFNNWGFEPPAISPPDICNAGENPGNQDFTQPADPNKPVTKVELRYNKISVFGYTHAYVLVTAPNGDKTVIRAGPGGNGIGSSTVPGNQSDWDGTIFGDLHASVSDAYDSKDYTEGEQVASQEVLATNASYDSVVKALSDFADAVNNEQINYNPFAANSNSFAHEAVSVLGVQRPTPAAWAPGSGTKLKCN